MIGGVLIYGKENEWFVRVVIQSVFQECGNELFIKVIGFVL